MSGSVKSPVEQVLAQERIWLLCYYDGNDNKTVIVEDLPIEKTGEFVFMLLEQEYSIHCFVQLHSKQLEPFDESGEGKIIFSAEDEAFGFIRDLSRYIYNSDNVMGL